ncbi:MAG: type II toxin-antitoxin system Phd/YefM family antitoxin [Planctomycetes bacterium]|nr:type II toxin-antitoxin system Phd/YefM family antitoxin [Planctomycetota bacterium]
MKLTASKLRQDIYRILDEILETGKPVEIERKGRLLRIAPADRPTRSKLDALEPHPDTLACDPEDIVHIDWSSEWKP